MQPSPDDLVIPDDGDISEMRTAIDALFHEAAFPGAEIRRLAPLLDGLAADAPVITLGGLRLSNLDL